MTEPVVELRGVTFGYPPEGAIQPVLEDVSLVIEPREFLGVIGPNGGGKTTLLEDHPRPVGAAAGQRDRLRPAAGRRVRRRIGYVPQHARVDPSVPANVLDVVLTGRLGRSPWGLRYGRHTPRRPSRPSIKPRWPRWPTAASARSPAASGSGC